MNEDKLTEREIALKLHGDIIAAIETKQISLKELSRKAGIKYTTFFSWLENLQKGKCISIKNILILEKELGIKLIFLPIKYD